MAPPKIIDWTKPVRTKCRVLYSREYSYEAVKVLQVYGDKAFVTWGPCLNAFCVGPFGDIDGVEGVHIENVPEEPVKELDESANCVALIKYADDCRDVSCRRKWFICPGQQDKDGDITPMCRSELESLVKGCDPYVIVELPS